MAHGTMSPSANPARKRSSISGIAIVLVAAGAVVLWNNIGGWGPKNMIRIALTYWPCVLVGVGISKIFFDTRKRLAAGIAFLLVGGFLQLVLLDWLPGDIGDYWPVMFILAGLWLLLVPPSIRGPEAFDGDALALDEFFAHRSLRLSASPFSGGTCAATLSRITVDLNACVPESRVVVTCDVLLSRVELRIPSAWRVTVTATTTLGSVLQRTGQRAEVPESAAPELVIQGTVALGRILVQSV
ncbi:MAG: hypothetical protein IPP94_14270 [Ignavibacteria bacterium]|nr:hypothetical protein [Ignavibacteria bacterium]